MIRVVVSVGTDHHPFDRILDWIEVVQQQSEIDVFVQRGATAERADVESVDYLAADELARLMSTADAVVCHGGPGTISLARKSGHRPIVVARDPDRGEHVDDHQQRYTAKLAEEGRIDTARSVGELIALVTTPRQKELRSDHAAAIAEAVENFGGLVERLLNGQLPRRRWRDRILIRRTK